MKISFSSNSQLICVTHQTFAIASIVKNKSSSKYIFTGIQILKSKIFLEIKKKKFPLSLIYDQLIEKRRIFGVVYNGSWFHIGTLESLKEYKMMLK